MHNEKNNSVQVKWRQMLGGLAESFGHYVELQKYSEQLLLTLENNFGFKKSVLKVISRSIDELRIEASRGISKEFESWNISELGKGISGKVAVTGNISIINDLIKDERTNYYSELFQKEGVFSLICLPIATKEKIIGVLEIYGDKINLFSSDLAMDINAVISFASIFIDIIEQRDASRNKLDNIQNHLRKMEQMKSFHDLIFENIPIAVIATDAKGYVLLMNKELERMSLENRVDCLGKKWDEAFGISDELRDKLIKGYQSSSSQFYPEIVITRRDGSLQPIEIMTEVIRDYSDEHILGAVAICSDIKEKKQIEREIEKIERLSAIGKLSASIAHEIRNPLAGISGALQTIKKRMGNEVPAGTKEILDRVFAEINRLDNVVYKLQDLATPRHMEFEPYSISDIVEDSLFFLHKIFQNKKIRLSKRLDKNMIPVLMDKSAIKQVILNVLINAANFMPTGGDLTVETMKIQSIDLLDPQIIWDKSDVYLQTNSENSTKNKMHYVAAIVSDNGPGISRAIIPKIFDAFFSTYESGTGLGLYLSSRFVAMHRGMIGCVSSKNKGADFYILLPQRNE